MLKNTMHKAAAAPVTLVLLSCLTTMGLAAETEPAFDPLAALQIGAPAAVDLPAEREKLADQIKQGQGPLDEANARIAAANSLLALPTAGPATRWLLGFQSQADLKLIGEAGREAADQLTQARSLLQDIAKPDNEKDRDRLRNLTAAAETLDAFAAVLRLADLPAGTEENREAWRKAGRGLAIARESEGPVATAALLWQAFALEQAGRRDRALEALPDAMAKPEHLPYGLMSRLVRCRMITEAGQPAAATALLSRIEGQLKDWTSNQNQERNKARRLVGLVQYQVVTRWMEQPGSADQPNGAQTAQTLEPIRERIRRSFAEVKSPEVYYMNAAIPPEIAPALEKQAGRPAAPAETSPASAAAN